MEVNHKEKDGTFVANGRVDKLATALNKTEHSGRVVGVGAYVTPKQFFDVPKQSKSDMLLQNQQWSLQQQKLWEERDKQVETLMAQVKDFQEELNLSKTQHQYQPYIPQYPQNILYGIPPQNFPHNPLFGSQSQFTQAPQQYFSSTIPQHQHYPSFMPQHFSQTSPQRQPFSPISRQPQFSPSPQNHVNIPPIPPQHFSSAVPNETQSTSQDQDKIELQIPQDPIEPTFFRNFLNTVALDQHEVRSRKNMPENQVDHQSESQILVSMLLVSLSQT